MSESMLIARSKYAWPFSFGLAWRVVRFRSWTPRLCSRSPIYLLTAERDRRSCRAASEKLPSSTTFTKARRLASLSILLSSAVTPATVTIQRLSSNHIQRCHKNDDCLCPRATEIWLRANIEVLASIGGNYVGHPSCHGNSR